MRLHIKDREEKTTTVTWDKYTGHADRLIVYRDSISSPVATVPITVTQLVLPYVAKACYWIIAWSGNVSSPPSNIIQTPSRCSHNPKVHAHCPHCGL